VTDDKGSVSSALGGLDALIDHSLLHQAGPSEGDGGSRLQMLETIRECGYEHLLSSSDMKPARQAHASYYLQLAEEVAQAMQGPHRGKWLDRLEQEQGIFKRRWNGCWSGKTWYLLKRSRKMALHLANALSQFWTQRGYLSEGWRFVEQALQAYAAGEEQVTLPLAKTYLLAASMNLRLGGLERAGILVEQSITYGIALENHVYLAEALRLAGGSLTRGARVSTPV
jgi:hypothetical protein